MPTKTEIKEAYDSVATEYDDYMEKTGHAEAQRKIVGLLKDDIRGKVLDVGTGTGIIGLEITKQIPNSQVRITDLSEKMLQRAWANARATGYNNLSFLVDDIEDSVLADNQFDTVICCLGMLWFIDKDKALREMARICKDSGRIILIEEEGEPLRVRKSSFNKRLLSFFSRIEKLETPISFKEIEEKMTRLGYGVTSIVKERIDEDHGFVGMTFRVRKCKLCLEKKKLKDSHIIPEFMYESTGLYDEKHRFRMVRLKDLPEFVYQQKGLREVLLCGECEGRISRWEQYAQRTLHGGHNPKCVKQSGQKHAEYVLFTGIDYEKFKLFLLSMLWRASVSNLDQFRQVRLGPHQERIRKMILEENPGGEDDYGCMIIAIRFPNNDLKKFIIPPERQRVGEGLGHNCYRFFVGGLIYHFVVSKHNIPAKVREHFLNRSNELRIRTEKMENVPYILSTLLDTADRIKRMEI